MPSLISNPLHLGILESQERANSHITEQLPRISPTFVKFDRAERSQGFRHAVNLCISNDTLLIVPKLMALVGRR
jgi:hypothetical protein